MNEPVRPGEGKIKNGDRFKKYCPPGITTISD